MSIYATEHLPARAAHWVSLAATGVFIVAATATSFTAALLFASGILAW